MEKMPQNDKARRDWLASLRAEDTVAWFHGNEVYILPVRHRTEEEIELYRPGDQHWVRPTFTAKLGKGRAGRYPTGGYIAPVTDEARRVRHLMHLRKKLLAVNLSTISDDQVEIVARALGIEA